MLQLLIGVVGSFVVLLAGTEHHPPVDQPSDQFPLPLSVVGGGPITETVKIVPQSEFKYANIVRQAYDYSCGSAALTTILQSHLGLKVSEQQAMEGMLEKGEKDKIIARRGFSLLDMKRYVASLGLDSQGFRAKVEDLRKLEHPAIVPIDYGGFKHFVVLRGVRDGKVYIADPSAGHFVLSVDEFAQWWDRNTLFVVYPAADQKPAGLLALSEREMGVIDPDRWRDGVSIDNTAALRRAVDTSLGGVYYRR